MRLLILSTLLAAACWANQGASGWCEQGGQVVLTGAVQSTTTVQQSYPQCVVTVYVTGTATKATIYANNNATPTPLSNPFTSSVTGLWQFFAANGVYDVQFSGSNIPAPFTIGAVTLFDQYAANDPFNILGYGAVGDGITDNSGAIQKAFNAAQAAGGTVLIPPGNFKYSTTLIVTGSGLTVVGTGYLSNLSYTGGSGIAINVHSSSGLVYRTHFSNFRLIATNPGAQYGFVFNGVQESGLSNNMTVGDGGGFSVAGWYGENVGIISIDNCIFSNNAVGILLDTVSAGPNGEVNINENNIFNSSASAIRIESAAVANVTQNYIEETPTAILIDNTNPGGYAIVNQLNILGNNYNATITGGQLLAMTSTTAANTLILERALVEGNIVISNPAVPYLIQTTFVGNTSAAFGFFTIRDNLLYGASTAGIYADAATGYFTLQDNLVEASFDGSASPEWAGSGTYTHLNQSGSGFTGFDINGNGAGAATYITNTGSGNAISAVSGGGTGVYGTSTSGVGIEGSTSGSPPAVEGLNAGAGPGVSGTSASGAGTYGTSTSGYGIEGSVSSASAGVAGINVGAGIGVLGNSTSGPAVEGAASTTGDGVYGTASSGKGTHGAATSGDGAYGLATTGIGVYGTSTSGNGVFGTTGNSSIAYGVLGSVTNAAQATGGINAGTGVGIYGSAQSGVGVYGTSVSGYAVYGIEAGSSVGVFGTSTSGNGTEGSVNNSASAVIGINAGTGQAGLFNSNSGPAVYALSTTGYLFVGFNNSGFVYSINNKGAVVEPTYQLTSGYSVAGTPLPTCNSASVLTRAGVIDAQSATSGTTYTGSGAIVITVECIYNTGYVWSIR